MTIVDIYPIIRLPIIFALDAVLGKPDWLVNPVDAISSVIAGCKKNFIKIFPKTPQGERSAGICTAIFVCAISFIIPALFLYFLFRMSRRFYIPHLGYVACIVDVFFGYQLIESRSIAAEAKSIYKSIAVSLKDARKKLGEFAGFKTENFDAECVVRATVETVSEKTIDDVVSPLFFFAIGGSSLAFLCKAVNIIKYKNLGPCASKLYEVFNYIPARIAAFCMFLSSVICNPISIFPVRYSPKNAFEVYKRDKKNSDDINVCQTESVCAGALGITLGGDIDCGGITVHRPVVGNQLKFPDSIDIERSAILMYVSSALAVFFFMAVRFLFAVIF